LASSPHWLKLFAVGAGWDNLALGSLKRTKEEGNEEQVAPAKAVGA
jgi:hypothetical protein